MKARKRKFAGFFIWTRNVVVGIPPAPHGADMETSEQAPKTDAGATAALRAFAQKLAVR